VKVHELHLPTREHASVPSWRRPRGVRDRALARPFSVPVSATPVFLVVGLLLSLTLATNSADDLVFQ